MPRPVAWYFAINEAGANSGLGLHVKLAVLSARLVGGLAPHLLYFGRRGAFTEWMQAQDVRVTDFSPTFLPAFEEAVRAGRHPAGFDSERLYRVAPVDRIDLNFLAQP